MSPAKVKYPITAAVARFLPIFNHLENMQGYLNQANLNSLWSRIIPIRAELEKLEREMRPLATLERKKP